MFTVNHTDIGNILRNFGIVSAVERVSELQRCDYEHNDFTSKEEVRLIVKVELASAPPLVIRFRNESDLLVETVESQSSFADQLRKNGITTPCQYQLNGAFAKRLQINGYDVIVTVEQFAQGEVTTVDAAVAEKTGELLAKMHSVSEKHGLHVQNSVLFDPFSPNELFDFHAFQSLGPNFKDREKTLFDQIVQQYHVYMDTLAPLKNQPGYAVQGDISNCNLYRTVSGEIGIFDFNRCGDNNLFCDAVMQAVFEARLMDYSDDAGDSIRPEILASFLRGYRSVRDFSEEQRTWYPYLCAIINAFWSADIRWNQDSLMGAVKRGDMEGARKWLETIWQKLRGKELICMVH